MFRAIHDRLSALKEKVEASRLPRVETEPHILDLIEETRRTLQESIDIFERAKQRAKPTE